MIDASHANSGKQPERQSLVVDDIATRIAAGDRRIVGVMVESHLTGGRQDLVPGRALMYGQSITDACLGWADSVRLLERLALAIQYRRRPYRSEEHTSELTSPMRSSYAVFCMKHKIHK